MEWNDQGLVLGSRRHGETSAIVELMTREHGRSLGLVRGGRSRKMRPLLQPGNLVNVVWRARLDEHLGYYQLEGELLRAGSIMANRVSLYAIQILAAHLRLLPERQSQSQLFEAANIILDNADNAQITAHLIVRFEVALLEELGFGLNLSQCVVSGSNEDLAWVSPKSGGAVSRGDGEPWAAKLLPLPRFLTRGSVQGTPAEQSKDHKEQDIGATSQADLIAGMELTSYFLQRHVYVPRAINPPDERARLVTQISAQAT